MSLPDHGIADDAEAIDAFVDLWSAHEGGTERANYQVFLTGLCRALGLPEPGPSTNDDRQDAYVYEFNVKEGAAGGAVQNGWIDLYRKGCFVLEAKQTQRRAGGKRRWDEAAPVDPFGGPRIDSARAEVVMMKARRQAEFYVSRLPAHHPPPPFVIVCDIGRCLEIYANFRRDGKVYSQFPDRQGFQIRLADLRRPEIRARLRAIWLDPDSIDPARIAARATRDIAERLAAVTRRLEIRGYPAEEVALFLMRCLFTMFAEDTGLLPRDCFKSLLIQCRDAPHRFAPELELLWRAMDEGGYASAAGGKVRHFNGKLFAQAKAFPLGAEEIGEILAAAEKDWREVEPAIFGTLLEQALDPSDRRKLGAHYTPRGHVERLVVATVIEPLRADFDRVVETAIRQQEEGRAKEAIAGLRAFHDTLCDIKVLDPACGTGNFLYVALELMKKLEGDVLETLVRFGGQESITSLASHTVDPHQFLGIEVNPRAAAIAELVLWIGYLQWHFRTKGGAPGEPVLKAFGNIRHADAVLAGERELARDETGRPVTGRDASGAPVERWVWRNPKRPVWPQADFIVGNPPFLGGKDLRARLGDGYAAALWAAHPHMPESADFVLYWWDRAAELLTAKGTRLRRFGFVTTNSIAQVLQRRVLERHMRAKKPVSLVLAIPDHPWTKQSRDAAAVRIAMTVAEAGSGEGLLREVTSESGLETDQPVITFRDRRGRINADLTIGVDVTTAKPLRANDKLSSPGVKLHGAGFIVTPEQATHLGLGRRPGLERHIRPYRNGRDLTAKPRGVMVIDLFGLAAGEVRTRFPEVYQHLLVTVKPERDQNNEAYRRENWWLFGRKNTDLRSFLQGLDRYIATVETAKHRVFQFLDREILPDNRLVNFGLDDAYFLGCLSSSSHVAWTLAAGSTLEDRPIYTKSVCFDPFPFPDASPSLRDTIAALAEELDGHRKRVLAEHPALTLTGLYNVLDRLRAGVAPRDLAAGERETFEDGQVAILHELHTALDHAVLDAYGWPRDLAEDDILARLVALNAERAAQEAQGTVFWLRPDFQIPRLGAASIRGEQLEAALALADEARTKPAFPPDDLGQTVAVIGALAAADHPLDAAAIATTFRQGRRIAGKIDAILAALAGYGTLWTTDGRTYLLRRAA